MVTETDRPVVSIILPMYNEGENVYRNLKCILTVLGEMPVAWELLLIDDGSTDDTKTQAEKALSGLLNAHIISYKPNIGRGFALRKGFEVAKGDYIITTESDLSWGAEIIPKIYNGLISNDVDVVIVSPYIQRDGLINVPLKRRILSKLGNRILTFGLPGNLTMITGMARGYKREVIDRIILQMNGKEIHIEIISKLIAIGANIKEIPGTITWEKKDNRDKKRKSSLKTKKLIMSHLYFSLAESPLHFIGLLGLIFIGFGFIGIVAIIVLKIVGFSLRRIPFFPHYVFVSIIVGLLILIFSLISSQIRDFQRELRRMYAKIVKFRNKRK